MTSGASEARGRSLRIGLVHVHAWPDVRRGGERYLHDLAWYLGQQGHDVDVVVGADGEPGVEDVVDGTGATLHRYPRHRLSARVAGHLLRRRYDVVHALVPDLALAARLTGHPTVYTELGDPGAAYGTVRGRAARRWWAAVRTASAVTAISQPAADGFRKMVSRTPHVLPPGVRTEAFEPEERPRTGPPRLLFSGDLSAATRYKRLDVLVRAFPMVLAAHPDARLLLSGRGDPSWSLSAADEATVAAIDVLGLGPPEAVADRYRDATVTVLPSTREAFGLVLVESLACGTPVTAARSGGPLDIVTSEVGRLAEPRDPDDLGRAILEAIDLAADPAVPARCVAHARRWDWTSAVGPRHVALYRRVVAGRDAA